MNKTWLIIQREYLSRVRKKSFLLGTFLTPLMLAGIMAIVIVITVKSEKQEKIAVGDKTEILKPFLKGDKNLLLDFVTNADTGLLSKGYSAVLLAPGNGINTDSTRFQIYSRKNLSVLTEQKLNDLLEEAIQTRLITRAGGISAAEYDSIRSTAKSTGLDTRVLEVGREVKKGNSGVAFGIGYGSGFLIYIVLFLYGAMVMRGVMEEKTNRIAEVMVSSVRPVQLMMGKILGIGAVGITQFLLWIVLIFGLSTLIGYLIPPELMQQVNETGKGLPAAGISTQSTQAVEAFVKARQVFTSVNWWLILACFLFYFLFGYLFYASLFAAVGSAVNEDPQDAQSLMLPVTMPIILSIVILMNAINQPESSLATWASIIPFSSPIVMMARIPFGVPGTVPWWQLGLSMALLVLGFLATAWLSGRIYRTGILLYGKKVTLAEMWKWAFRKQ